MRRRSSCAAPSRDGSPGAPVIGKVIRGTDAKRLLYYLYGPGKANEHTDPHLVAGFSDPAELEPERRPDGSANVRRLAGLLNQPLAALAQPGYGKPVWHCAVRAAPGDRELSDQEWAQVATAVMDRTRLAPDGDECGVRWVAVRHAPDHVHLVATLARQDGARPWIWNDFYRVREACRDAEARFGLAVTAPADRTAARRPERAETEQAARRGWPEPPRTRLRREVCAAAAGALTEQDFFARLGDTGVLIRLRYSTIRPEQVTGYAVGLPEHSSPDGGTVWYGGGKLAADLTLPKLRSRWTTPGVGTPFASASGPPPTVMKATVRVMVAKAAGQAGDEPGFFARLRSDGVLVRLRFSEIIPGQITGYSVSLPGHLDNDGQQLWYGGGRLSEGLSLPRLRRRWNGSTEHSGRPDHGVPAFTAPERNAAFRYVGRQAADTVGHIRRCACADQALAADATRATADVLHIAARITGNHALGQAAALFDRASRSRYGRTPVHTKEGHRLRSAARLLALAGPGSSASAVTLLAANLATLVIAVAELRQVQQRAAQAHAAHQAAKHLSDAYEQAAQAARLAGRRVRMSLTVATEPPPDSDRQPRTGLPEPPSQDASSARVTVLTAPVTTNSGRTPTSATRPAHVPRRKARPP
jgi:hypothetical protein